MADVPAAWDIINLAFGEPTSVTSGDIRFNLCPVAECPDVESEAEFNAAIRAKQAAGQEGAAVHRRAERPGAAHHHRRP